MDNDGCVCCAALQSARPSRSGPAAWWCWQTRAWSSTALFKETLFPLSAGEKMILTCLRAGNAQRPSWCINVPWKPRRFSTPSFISRFCVSVLPADSKSWRTIPWLFAKWPLRMRAPIHAWWRTWSENLKHLPRLLYTVSTARPLHVMSSNHSAALSSVYSSHHSFQSRRFSFFWIFARQLLRA